MVEPVSSIAASSAWHAVGVQGVLDLVESSRSQGLNKSQVQRRAADFGRNILPPPKRRGPMKRFLTQFNNILIFVLLASAAITAGLGHWVDSGVVIGVVTVNALIGFIQEGKAERALDAIRQMLSFNAQVLRDGRHLAIPANELVPGDIVFLASGDKVPADLRLLEVRSLRVEEAALTGESVATEKGVEAVPSTAPLGERSCMAYSGTIVSYGQGVGVVVAIGSATEIGHISAMLADVHELATPLLRQIAIFGRWLTALILVLAGITFIFGTQVRAYSAADMFIAAVSLAVAAIPEGLPAIMTIALAIGVQRMAQRNAIIRRLPAVEALGSVTVICTDKTGTLTRNEMAVRRVMTSSASFNVSGVGYAPYGGFVSTEGDVEVAVFPLLKEIAQVALLCNDASLRQIEDRWEITGDPTEGALISFALKSELDESVQREALPRIDAIPFESEHRFMATLHHDHEGKRHVFLKGAPERILPLCEWQRDDGRDQPLDQLYWQRQIEKAASEGMRLLALARRTERDNAGHLSFACIERGRFTLLAVLAMADPARDEAIEAVARCRAAGIQVKMITGDHLLTARAIGEQLRLAEEIKALTGPELEAMDDSRLAEVVGQTHIFARASPEHKLRLVQALQRCEEVVAMTGDGINDAPALKRADVGIAMGGKGTEAAKEVADIVLTDDNFNSIAAAVEEGRAIYENIRKAIVFILPTNGGEAGMLMIAILLGLELPITPVQILWVNMITAVTLSLAIAFEPPEENVMAQPPRSTREPLLTGFLVWRISFVTLLLVGGCLSLFLWELEQGASLATARTVAVNALVMGEIAYLFNVRRFTKPALTWKGIFQGKQALLAVGLLLLFQALFTYLPAMHHLFGTTGLDATAFGRIVAFGVMVFLVVEGEKWLRSHLRA